MTSLFQTSLLEDAVQRARREIVARFTGDSDSAGLACMLELSVATAYGYKIPAISLQETQHFANFHSASIAGRGNRPPTQGETRSYWLRPTFELTGRRKLAKPAVAFPVQRRVRPSRMAVNERSAGLHCHRLPQW